MDGYKIIDFKGIDIANGAEITGIFNEIKISTKPLIFSNINIGGITPKPFYAGMDYNDNDEAFYFLLTLSSGNDAGNIVLEINADDSVSATPLE